MTSKQALELIQKLIDLSLASGVIKTTNDAGLILQALQQLQKVVGDKVE